jgi:hypothetical protein
MNLEPAESLDQEAIIADEIAPKVIEANPAEDKAREGGWKPKEDWKGEPEEWRSAEVFNERGEWIEKHKAQQKRMDNLESTVESRLENQRKLMELQSETQKNELIRKRDDAIDEADRDKANKYQEDIDSLNKSNETVTNSNNPEAELNSWNANNPWIMQNNPKAAYGKQQFASYQQQGMNSQQAIAAMEADVGREFPDINPQRLSAPLQEGGTPPGGIAKPRKLTMSDLTGEEKKYYQSMPSAWKDQGEFLQAVQDVRGES